MRVPRLRFSMRSLLLVVASNGVILAWAIDRAKKGYPLVVFEYSREIEDEPLVHPMKVRAIEEGCFMLEDGRALRVEDKKGLIDLDRIGTRDLLQGKIVLDVESNLDGAVIVHALMPSWHCGGNSRSRFLPMHVPIVPRTVFRNHRVFVGAGSTIKMGSNIRF